MAVKIKLMRLGKIRAPYYRIVVADSRTKRDGRSIETIGKYHPTEEPSLIVVDSARAQYWLSVGAQPTEPVAAILKITGDWQKFKGLPGAEGTLRVAEPKVAKKTLFEAAARESGGHDPHGPATTPKVKKAAKAVATEAAEGTAAARPTADEAAADGDVRAAGSGSVPSVSEAPAPVEASAPAEASAPTEPAAPAEASAPTETAAPAEAAAPAEGSAPAEA